MDERLRATLRTLAERYHQHASACHRLDHTERVVANALELARYYPEADTHLLETAAWLHDIGRGIERRQDVSHADVSAELARELLPALSYTPAQVELISTAVADHRFSTGRVPSSVEGRLLQDADRLDAIGAIGIARAFSESENRALYHHADPCAEERPLDDHRYILDHFFTKLLTLAETMHTAEARALAATRTEFLRIFVHEFARELHLDTNCRLRPDA